jgi:REP element-mobilizing transposase RayT
MRYDPVIHHRRSIRLAGHDYSLPGAYFVTTCTRQGLCLFGKVEDGRMRLNPAGKMVAEAWGSLGSEFDFIVIDDFVVMPNHLHGVIWLKREGEHEVRPYDEDEGDCPSGLVGPSGEGEHEVRPYDDGRMPRGTARRSLGRVIQRFKSITTVRYIEGAKRSEWRSFHGKLWLRNYFERVVRNDDELNAIRAYIATNPSRWRDDPENPSNS